MTRNVLALNKEHSKDTTYKIYLQILQVIFPMWEERGR